MGFQSETTDGSNEIYGHHLRLVSITRSRDPTGDDTPRRATVHDLTREAGAALHLMANGQYSGSINLRAVPGSQPEPGKSRESLRVLGEVLTAVVTPFDAYWRRRPRPVTASSVAFLVENGSDGSSSTATTGEAPTLSDDERLELIASRGRRRSATARRSIAGTGTNSTAHSVHLTERAHELGARQLLVVTPLLQQAAGAAASSSTSRPSPPRATGRSWSTTSRRRVVINIETETIAQLAEIPNVPRSQAGERATSSRRAAIVELGARPLRGRRRPGPAVRRARGNAAGSACTRTSSGRR